MVLRGRRGACDTEKTPRRMARDGENVRAVRFVYEIGEIPLQTGTELCQPRWYAFFDETIQDRTGSD